MRSILTSTCYKNTIYTIKDHPVHMINLHRMSKKAHWINDCNVICLLQNAIHVTDVYLAQGYLQQPRWYSVASTYQEYSMVMLGITQCYRSLLALFNHTRYISGLKLSIILPSHLPSPAEFYCSVHNFMHCICVPLFYGMNLFIHYHGRGLFQYHTRHGILKSH